jgi:hypothetical protein
MPHEISLAEVQRMAVQRETNLEHALGWAKHCEALQALRREQRGGVLERAKFKEVKKGQALVRTGEPIGAISLLLKGRLHAQLPNTLAHAKHEASTREAAEKLVADFAEKSTIAALSVRACPGTLSALRVSHSKSVLYERTGRLTAQNGGFWSGQKNKDLGAGMQQQWAKAVTKKWGSKWLERSRRTERVMLSVPLVPGEAVGVTVRGLPGWLRFFRVFHSNYVFDGRFYGEGGRLTAHFGGVWPGQKSRQNLRRQKAGLKGEALCAVTVGAVEDSALMVISNPGDILAIEKGLEKLREVKFKELFKFGQLSSAGATNLRGMAKQARRVFAPAGATIVTEGEPATERQNDFNVRPRLAPRQTSRLLETSFLLAARPRDRDRTAAAQNGRVILPEECVSPHHHVTCIACTSK